MSHVQTVREMYAAFGRGDVPAILAHLADNVEWEYAGASTDVPWLQPRRGRAQVAEFFQALTLMDIHQFQPKALLEGDGLVVALFALEATVKATGRRIVEDDEVHIWYFGADGKVTRFRHRVDSYQQWAAYAGK